MENSIDHKPQKSRTTMMIVLAFLLGILIGLMLHDTLIQHAGNAIDMKSWYPR